MALSSPEKSIKSMEGRKSYAFFEADGTFSGTFSLSAEDQKPTSQGYTEDGRPSRIVLEIITDGGVLNFPAKKTSELKIEDFEGQLEQYEASVDIPSAMLSLEALSKYTVERGQK